MSGALLAENRRMILLAILLVAFALRCVGLDAQELRGDEAFGYFFSLPSFGDIVKQTLDLSEPHPVASYWLQHSWLEVAGDSEFALRFPGVLWGVLAVALILPLAVRLSLPSEAGVVAAALMALSPYTIWHAQDARMYSMSLALTMVSTWLAIGWWRATDRAQHFGFALGYVGVTWLALHTHYFALYIVVAQNIALLGWAIAERAWRKLALWWGLALLLLLAWLPWLLGAWSVLTGYGGNGDSPGLLDALVRAHSAYIIGESAPPFWRWLVAVVTTGAMALGALALWRSQMRLAHDSLWFLVVYWWVPLAATWLSALNRPIFNERYLVAAVPPVYLLMGAATVMVRRVVARSPWAFWGGRALAILILAAMIVGYVRQSSDPAYSKTRGWRELAVALEQLTLGVDPMRVRLVQNYPDPTLWYYYRGDVPHLVLPPAANDRSLAAAEVERLVSEGVGRVILIEQPAASWDAAGVARDVLSNAYVEAALTHAENWPLSIWLRPTLPLHATEVEYEGGLHLTGVAIVPSRLPIGGVVEVYLGWQGNTQDQESVSLQVLDGAGELVAQSDRSLEMASSTTAQVESYAILLPMTLAMAEYQVSVVIYDPSREGAPRRLTVQGADRVVIGELRIVSAE